MASDLRDYQDYAVTLTASHFARHPAGSLLLTLPPAAGKTHIGARVTRDMVFRIGLRGLAIAHRREIVDSIYEKIVGDGVPAEKVGVVMADDREALDPRYRPDAPIQVASIATLLARGLHPAADLLWSDECHLDAADQRGAFIQRYRKGGTFILGTTATPVRLDGRGFGDLYDRLEVVVQPDDLVERGFISSPLVWTVPKEYRPQFDREPGKGRDFSDEAVARAANRPVLVGSIVGHWLKRARNFRTLVFASTREHSRSIVARFNTDAREGIAMHLDGDASPRERRAVLESLESGRTKIVSSCMLLTAGTDLPFVRCVILARPTKSVQLHIQSCGRVFRLFRRKGNLVRPVILDHAGNYMRRGLGDPLARREDWSLDGAPEGDGGVAPMKDCPCGAVCATGCATCPECGAAFDMSREPVEDEAAELVRWASQQRTKIEADVRAALDRMGHGGNEPLIQRIVKARLTSPT